jgi:hypothetical protein
MNKELEALKAGLAKAAGYKYATKEDAIQQGCCIKCGEKAEGRNKSEASKREWFISGLCEVCWDDLFTGEED